jgi:hypothetical protein
MTEQKSVGHYSRPVAVPTGAEPAQIKRPNLIARDLAPASRQMEHLLLLPRNLGCQTTIASSPVRRVREPS